MNLEEECCCTHTHLTFKAGYYRVVQHRRLLQILDLQKCSRKQAVKTAVYSPSQGALRDLYTSDVTG